MSSLFKSKIKKIIKFKFSVKFQEVSSFILKKKSVRVLYYRISWIITPMIDQVLGYENS